LIINEANTGYEPPTRDLLERVLRPGDLFVDVGAHWGLLNGNRAGKCTQSDSPSSRIKRGGRARVGWSDPAFRRRLIRATLAA
jgi:hypothetical protein